jgi:hypothetical protein
VVDNKIDKFKLVSGQYLTVKKSGKRLLRCGLIEANQ